MDYLVSIVIPVFNGEKYLKQSIDSVLSQPCVNQIEIILVNDGSKDNSDKICEQYRKKDKIIYLSQENMGVAHARNNGLKCANGKYVMFLDCDDVLVSGFFDNSIMEKLEAGDCDVYGFSYFKANSGLNRCSLVFHDDCIVEGCGNFMPSWNSHSSFLINREMLVDNNLEYPHLKANEDEVFRFMFLLYSKKTQLINKPIFYYRRNAKSVTHTKKDSFELMTPIIEVWQNMKTNEQCLSKINNVNNYIKFCDVMINIGYFNLICLSMKQFYSSKKIMSKFQELETFEYWKNNYKSSDSGLEKKRLFTEFLESPKKLHFKMLFLGIKENIKHKLSCVKFIEEKYDRIRYDIQIEN